MALGRTLADARKRAGMSVEDVAAATRVRGAVIHAIEAEDFRACGGDIYARGHIRAIARCLGVAPEPLIAEFDSEHALDAITVAQVFEADRTYIPERRGLNWSAVMAMGLVAVIAATAFTIANRGGTPDDEIASPLPTASSSATPSATDDSSAPEPEPTGIEADASGVVVQLSYSGASWVRVSNAEGVLFEGIERAGGSRTFRDDTSLSVVLGNAGAVRLVVNGEDRGQAGSDGQVVRETFLPR